MNGFTKAVYFPNKAQKLYHPSPAILPSAFAYSEKLKGHIEMPLSITLLVWAIKQISWLWKCSYHQMKGREKKNIGFFLATEPRSGSPVDLNFDSRLRSPGKRLKIPCGGPAPFKWESLRVGPRPLCVLKLKVPRVYRWENIGRS